MNEIDVDSVATTATTWLTRWGLQALAALVVLVVGLFVARAIRSGMRGALTRAHVDETLRPFLAGLVYYLVLAFVIIAVLQLFGLQVASLVAVLGAIGLAVGLALQGTLSHVASGVLLLTFRPLRVGDYVEVAGTAGTVVEVGIFSTTLKSPDNVRIIVPNSKIYADVIRNYDGFDTRRVDLVVGIAYDDDIGTALDTIERVLAEDDRVLAEPEPTIAVAELGDSSVNVVVRPWTKGDDYWPLRFDLTRELKERLEAAGCSIPFPQRDLHLVSVPEGLRRA